VFVTPRGEPYQLWRAVDQHGAKLDIGCKSVDQAAAKRFFERVACRIAAVIRSRQHQSPGNAT